MVSKSMREGSDTSCKNLIDPRSVYGLENVSVTFSEKAVLDYAEIADTQEEESKFEHIYNEIVI